MKILFSIQYVVFFIFTCCLHYSYISAQENAALSLEVEVEKPVYHEGDEIALIYTIKNISDKAVYFYNYTDPDELSSNDLEIVPLSMDKKPLKTIHIPMQTNRNYFYVEKFELLPGEQNKSKRQIFGKILFDKLTKNTSNQKDSFSEQQTIYEGFVVMLSTGTYLPLPQINRGFLLSPKCCFPEPQTFTEADCKKLDSNGNTIQKFDSTIDKMEFMLWLPWLRIYCAEIKKPNLSKTEASIFSGCISDEPKKVNLDLRLSRHK